MDELHENCQVCENCHEPIYLAKSYRVNTYGEEYVHSENWCHTRTDSPFCMIGVAKPEGE